MPPVKGGFLFGHSLMAVIVFATPGMRAAPSRSPVRIRLQKPDSGAVGSPK